MGVVTLAGAQSEGQQLLWLVEEESHLVCEGEKGKGSAGCGRKGAEVCKDGLLMNFNGIASGPQYS